jgi:hypothetical protein
MAMPTPRKYADDATRQRAYRQRKEKARIEQIRAKGIPSAAAISSMPSSARWNALIQHAEEALRTLRDEMESYADERSENWKESDKAADFQDRLDQIEEALSILETID